MYRSHQQYLTPPLEAAICTLKSIFSIPQASWLPILALRGRKQ
jgi:hypothetical protein